MAWKRVRLGRMGTVVVTEYQQEIMNGVGEYLREFGESRFGLVLGYVQKATGRNVSRYQLWHILLIMGCKRLVIFQNKKKQHEDQWRQIIKPSKRLLD